jgi:hypothetical protein
LLFGKFGMNLVLPSKIMQYKHLSTFGKGFQGFGTSRDNIPLLLKRYLISKQCYMTQVFHKILYCHSTLILYLILALVFFAHWKIEQ